MFTKVIGLAVVQNYIIGWVLHYVYLPADAVQHDPGEHAWHSGHAGASVAAHAGHGGHGAESSVDPLLHFLRDSTLALPATVTVLVAVALAGRALSARIGLDPRSVQARLGFAVAVAVATAAVSVPEVLVHSRLFDEQVAGVSVASHLTGVALVTLRYTFALVLVAALLFGVPWRAPRPATEKAQNAQ